MQEREAAFRQGYERLVAETGIQIGFKPNLTSTTYDPMHVSISVNPEQILVPIPGWAPAVQPATIVAGEGEDALNEEEDGSASSNGRKHKAKS